MTFEKALEAMKQGKKVRRKNNPEETCLFIKDEKIISMHYGTKKLNPYLTINGLSTKCMLADDWEIYEEPEQKEPEMTADFAKKLLETVRLTINKDKDKFSDMLPYYNVEDAVRAIDFAIKSLENKGKAEPEKKCERIYQPVEWFTTTLACTGNDNSEIINELKKEVRETIEREIKRIYYAEKAGLI